MSDDSNIVSEVASSIGAFSISSGLYWVSIPKPYVFDFILLGIASVLPTKVGLRIGTLAGLLLGPPIASHLSKLDRWATSLPREFLNTLIFVGQNGKFILGIVGGIIGVVAFLHFRRNLYMHRFWSNMFASGFTGFTFGAMSGLLLIVLGIGNRHPPPGLIPNLMVMAFKNCIIGAVAGIVVGVPLAGADLISRRNRYE